MLPNFYGFPSRGNRKIVFSHSLFHHHFLILYCILPCLLYSRFSFACCLRFVTRSDFPTLAVIGFSGFFLISPLHMLQR